MSDYGYIVGKFIVPPGSGGTPDAIPANGVVSFTPYGEKLLPTSPATLVTEARSSAYIKGGVLKNSTGDDFFTLIQGSYLVQTRYDNGAPGKSFDIVVDATHTQANPLDLNLYAPITPTPDIIPVASVAERERAEAAADRAEDSANAAQVSADAAAGAVITVGDGRYRRVLSELRSLAPGADARPLIQAAVNAASGTSAAELVIPEGDWTISSSFDTDVAIRIGASNVNFQGAGIDKTRFTSTLGRAVVGVIGTAGSPLDNVSVSGFTVTGDATTPNQRGLQVSYTSNFRADRIKARNAGNNGLNLYYSDGAIINQIEVTGSRDFGVLFYRSKNSKIVDAYAHDIGMGRSHLGIQFKSSQRCQAIRPRIERIQGYGFYVWDDGLDTTNYPDFGHTIENAQITDALSGGTFNPNNLFMSTSKNITVRGGRFVESVTGLISAIGVEGLVVDGIDELTGAHGAPALAVSGVSSFNIRGVRADGRGVSNELGILIAGTPKYGTVRDCRVINGAAGVSPDNAAMRLESTVTGVFIEHSDFSDYQTTKTQRRGMYDRTAAGVNYWKSNRSTGNITNKTIPAGSIDTDNVLV